MTSTGSGNHAPHTILQGIIRFALELAMLVCLGYFGYNLSETTLVRLFLALLLPAIAVTLWVVFQTPGDESAGKSGSRPVPGWLRLLMEVALFIIAAAGAWWAGSRIAAETLLTFAAIHYLATWQRVRWLLAGRERVHQEN